MEDFESRLQLELDELVTKVTKLSAFIDSEKFNDIKGNQQMLLISQLQVMELYRDILQERIELLK